MATQPPEHPRRVIAHLDCDSFYASVELQRRPELRGKPVVVAGSGPRAVVTTASYEARRFGVHSAMSAVRARRLCPHAIFLPPDFKAYRAKSARSGTIVRERLACPMQSVSVDEAYADVTAIEKPLRALRELVAEVRERTGITISVGVGPSRLVAKTASDAEKPAGFVVLSREQACERFAGEPTRLLQGVGPRTQERLAELGLHTVADLQAADTDELVARFGERMGRWLKAVRLLPRHVAGAGARGGQEPVERDDVRRGRRRPRRAGGDAAPPGRRRLRGPAAAANMRGRTIGIKVRLDDWTNATRARTIETFTNDQDAITDDRARAPARLRAGAAGAAARRARGVVRGRGRRAAVRAGGSARAGGAEARRRRSAAGVSAALSP